MLVLTRKPGQYIEIGDDIRIHVTDVRENQVKLAIDAPKDVRILRHDAKVRKVTGGVGR